MAENRVFPTTSSHVRGDIELDIRSQGFQDYKELRGSETPEALKVRDFMVGKEEMDVKLQTVRAKMTERPAGAFFF